MSSRMARELPKIEIGGTMFYLDLRLNEFRECNDFMNRMNLDDMNEIESGYLICFDLKTKNYFHGDLQEFEKRKDLNLIWVKLPMLQEMDPIGFGWLIEEMKEGFPIIAPAHFQKVYRENDSNQLEKVLEKAGLLYKTKNHPPLLEKKSETKSKQKKL